MIEIKNHYFFFFFLNVHLYFLDAPIKNFGREKNKRKQIAFAACQNQNKMIVSSQS
jgi:hypothetical protein